MIFNVQKVIYQSVYYMDHIDFSFYPENRNNLRFFLKILNFQVVIKKFDDLQEKIFKISTDSTAHR